MNDSLPSDKPEPCTKLINKLRPKPSCSNYALTDSDIDIKINIEVNNCKTEESEENEKETRCVKECENVHINKSNYQIYDENNNYMLTNLNDFGFTFFDINAEVSSEKCLCYNTSNDCFNDCINTSTEERNVRNDASKEANLDERNNKIDKNMDNIGAYSLVQNNNIELIDVKKNVKVDNKHTHYDQYINNVFFDAICNDKLLEIDIAQSLKCNLTVRENWNQTLYEKVNGELDDIKVDEINSFVDNESGDSAVKVNSIEETIDVADPVTIAHQTDDSDVCSYHSSDFEFIDELEAHKHLMIDFDKVETMDNPREFDNEYIMYDYFNIPGPSTPKHNVIPTGNDYDNLFLSPCVPYPCRNMENKAVHSMRGMKICDDAGFDMKFLLLQRNEDDNYKEEADESAKIIISMYPHENRGIHSRRHT